MASKTGLLALILAQLLVVPHSAAELRAYFRAESIEGGCLVDDQDPWPQGDPERIFRLAVAESASALDACSDGCPSEDGVDSIDYCAELTGCGHWNFPDRTATTTIPNQSAAVFYFGLFDVDQAGDGTISLDGLGDHWLTASGPASNTEPNNDDSPYHATQGNLSTVCGHDVDTDPAHHSGPGNFELSYEIWYTDSTAPNQPPRPSSPDYPASDDAIIVFNVQFADDPESGISERTARLLVNNVAQPAAPVSTASTVTVCASGCDLSYPLTHNDSVRLAVSVRNGLYPEIDNPGSSTSLYSLPVTIDLVDPHTSVTVNPDQTWHGANAQIEFSDIDLGSGIPALECRWKVLENGVPRLYLPRQCDATEDLIISAAGHCRLSGADQCEVTSMVTDNAGRMDSDTVQLSIDLIAPSVFVQPPATDAWFSDTTTLNVFEQDSLSGLHRCAFTVVDNGVTVIDDLSRVCDTPKQILIGNGQQCATTGQARCIVQMTAEDEVGHVSSDQVSLNIDLVPPQSEIEPAFTLDWHSGMVSLDPTESDLHSGLTLCEYRVESAGMQTLGWTTRDCYNNFTLTAAPDGPCTDQGVNRCRIYSRAHDAAGNSAQSDTVISVDHTGEPPTDLLVTSAGQGEVVPIATPTSHQDFHLNWFPSASASPVVGFSVAVDGSANCEVDVLNPAVQIGPLGEGRHGIQIRSLDEAGNCSAPLTRNLEVNLDVQFADGLE